MYFLTRRRPAEYWLPPAPQLPPGPGRDVNPCESDTHPQCDPAFNDTFFFTDIVEQITPYAIPKLLSSTCRAS